MSKYRKLIAAAVGLVVVVLGPDFIGVADLNAEMITEFVFSILTAIGVWAVPNEA